MKTTGKLYGRLAWAFPVITPLRHYKKETEQAFRLIRKAARIPVRTLLHLGCGGGHNDHFFRRHARVTGVDLSPAMLRLARRLNPDVAYLEGDMRKVRLGRTYDAVAAWDSVNHMTGPGDLAKVFDSAYRHLEKGGVFFFLLDTDRAQFCQGSVDGYVNRGKGVKIAFIENLYDPDPRDTHYETRFVFLIRRKSGFKVETDRFRCGLFSAGEVLALLRKRGFRARFLRYRPGAEAMEGCASGRAYYPAFIAVK